jgi:tetratricopeptide (TPR) repeat protein
MAGNSQMPAEPGAPGGGRGPRPVRAGPVPPLADGFVARPESAPGLGTSLTPGGMVALLPAQPAAEAAPDWLGSCGKTQLAVSCAESLWQSRGVDLLVWIEAGSRSSALSGYLEAAGAAMGTELAGDAESVAARFLSWLARRSRPWLVVLDDVVSAADLDGLWPSGPAGRVLVTTASPAVTAALPGAVVLPVGAFSPREALSYLMGRLTADTDQRLGAIDLVEDLGREPLALAHASAVIAGSALSCRDYRDYFGRRRDEMAATAAAVPAAAAVTWTYSFEQASRQSPGGAAQVLLGMTALLGGGGVPGDVFTTAATLGYLDLATGGAGERARAGGASAAGGGDRAGGAHRADPAGGRGTAVGASTAGADQALAAMLVLERAGLLTIDRAEQPPVVRMNQVVQTAVRATMPAEALDRAVRAAADALLEAWPDTEPRPWLADRLRASAASLQRAGGDRLWTDGCHPLLLRAGQSLNAARLAGPAVGYWSDLAAASDRILGSGHPSTLLIGEQLAAAYLTSGRAADAVPWWQWALARRGREFGPDHPGTIEARRNLGHALVAVSQFGAAITVLTGAADDYQRTRGPQHPETLGARDELAAAYLAAGQSGDAIRLYQRTLAERERQQGARHPEAMITRAKLAGAYLADGRIKAALPQYKRVLADREQVLGPEHLDTIAARGDLAAAYHTAGRMASALQLYEQTCQDYERILGPDHPDTLARRAALAHAYYAAGRITDATTLLRDALARCERVLPPGDPLTRTMRDSLANIAGE